MSGQRLRCVGSRNTGHCSSALGLHANVLITRLGFGSDDLSLDAVMVDRGEGMRVVMGSLFEARETVIADVKVAAVL